MKKWKIMDIKKKIAIIAAVFVIAAAAVVSGIMLQGSDEMDARSKTESADQEKEKTEKGASDDKAAEKEEDKKTEEKDAAEKSDSKESSETSNNSSQGNSGSSSGSGTSGSANKGGSSGSTGSSGTSSVHTHNYQPVYETGQRVSGYASQCLVCNEVIKGDITAHDNAHILAEEGSGYKGIALYEEFTYLAYTKCSCGAIY